MGGCEQNDTIEVTDKRQSPGQVSDGDPSEGLGGAALCQVTVGVSQHLGKRLREVILQGHIQQIQN